MALLIITVVESIFRKVQMPDVMTLMACLLAVATFDVMMMRSQRPAEQNAAAVAFLKQHIGGR